jgi:L-amino acid N-acyltransferase YncA
MHIRPAEPSDAPAIWAILEPIIREGEFFAYRRDLQWDEMDGLWHGPGREVFVVEVDGEVVGTYYIKPNQEGGGRHVANGGYATAKNQRGKGLARAMCLHSLDVARERGFRAMQFNFVVSSNVRAVHLWRSLGFQIVGTLPLAFIRPGGEEVDVFVMHRFLL